MNETPAVDSSSAPDRTQHLAEADCIALANQSGSLRVFRDRDRHIAVRYPTTVVAGLEPRLEARGNADVWILPLVRRWDLNPHPLARTGF